MVGNIRLREPFDAIVVGSGINGGIAAKQLCEVGLRTLILEAGPGIRSSKCYGSPATNFVRQLYSHVTGRQHIQERHPIYWQTNPRLFVDDRRYAYSTPPDKPFRWVRGRQMGGRSHMWGGVMLRLSDYEFKAASRDGIGEDWPISHADLDPYYRMLETFFCTHGERDGLAQLPDGAFSAASAMSPGERVFKNVVESRFPDRRVIISRGLRAKREPALGERFSQRTSIETSLAAAIATEKLTIQPHANVTRVLVSPGARKAKGVQYIDCATGERNEVDARVVFLCASTIESVRILMNSRSRERPEGTRREFGCAWKIPDGPRVGDDLLLLATGPRRYLQTSLAATASSFRASKISAANVLIICAVLAIGAGCNGWILPRYCARRAMLRSGFLFRCAKCCRVPRTAFCSTIQTTTNGASRYPSSPAHGGQTR